MKKLFSTVILFAIFFTGFAQINDATEIVADRTVGKTNGYKVYVPKSDKKQLESGFKSWMKEYKGKVEYDKKTGEMVARNITIPSMGESKYTIYSVFAETSEGAYLTAFVGVGDVYVTGQSRPEKSVEWIRLMTKFANDQAAKIVEKELSVVEKTLQSTGKDFEKLKKDQASYEKDIADCEARIMERKAQLEKNAADQTNVQSQLSEQQVKVDQVKEELRLYTK